MENYKVVWTDPALETFGAILSRIRQDNVTAAESLGDEIIQRVDMLADFPHSGAIFRRSQNREIREIIVGNYRVFYRAIDEHRRVEILTVWHGARRPPRFLN